MTSMLVEAPASKAMMVIFEHFVGRGRRRSGAGQRPLLELDRRAGGPHFGAGLQPDLFQRQFARSQVGFALAAQAPALAAVVDRLIHRDEEPPGAGRLEQAGRSDVGGIERHVRRRPPVLRAVPHDALREIALGAEQAIVGARGQPRLRCADDRHLEGGLAGDVDRAIGVDQHAERFLRALDVETERSRPALHRRTRSADARSAFSRLPTPPSRRFWL